MVNASTPGLWALLLFAAALGAVALGCVEVGACTCTRVSETPTLVQALPNQAVREQAALRVESPEPSSAPRGFAASIPDAGTQLVPVSSAGVTLRI